MKPDSLTGMKVLIYNEAWYFKNKYYRVKARLTYNYREKLKVRYSKSFYRGNGGVDFDKDISA